MDNNSLHIPDNETWQPKKSIKEATEIKDFSSLPLHIDIIIVVVNDFEFCAVFELLEPLQNQSKIWRGVLGTVSYYIGRMGIHNAALVPIYEAGMASALPQMMNAMKQWKARAVLNVGIAYGMKKGEQQIADVLVSMKTADLDMKKVKTTGVTSTTAIPEIAPGMRAAIMMAASGWEFFGLEGRQCKAFPGLIVSSDTLVNDPKLKKNIAEAWPLAIGGEMECYALYTAARFEGVPWILIKGISDWGDGTKSLGDPYHALASASAASLLHEFCQVPNALNAIKKERYDICAEVSCDLKMEHRELKIGGMVGELLGKDKGKAPKFKLPGKLSREYRVKLEFVPAQLSCTELGEDWIRVKERVCQEFVNQLHARSLLRNLEPALLIEEIDARISHQDRLLGLGTASQLAGGTASDSFVIPVHIEP